MFIFIRLINCRIRMFKAVKMKRLKFLLLSFVLGCAMLAGHRKYFLYGPRE